MPGTPATELSRRLPHINMKHLRNLSIALIIVLLAGWIVGMPAAYAAVASWQKGASIEPRWNTDFGSDSFKQSLRNLHATGANYVTLIIPWKQSNIYSTDVRADGGTPTDESLAAGIDYAHSLGLKVNLKPHLDSYDGQWRAAINPGDRASWFANYGALLFRLADIARTHGVEEITVGTELIKMAAATENGTNTENWQNLIAGVRARFGGQLTYSANWGPSGFVDEKNNIQFWSSLDSIGISAYFNLGSDYNNAVDHLKAEWANWQGSISALSQRWGKPVLFTEIGYKSVTGSHTQPWNFNFGGPTDQTEQANDYEALFSFWNDYGYMIGVQGWKWSSDS